MPDFRELAAQRSPPLEEVALALASEFRSVNEHAARAELDRLGVELAEMAEHAGSPVAQAEACRHVLGQREGFSGERDDYDNPDNSMLDLVLERRRGLPILLSIVYVAVAERSAIDLAGVGLPGHYVVGHFGAEPPLLLDPFNGGVLVETDAPPEVVRRWSAHETALRMLTNLVGSYARRADLGSAIRAADLRLALPLSEDVRQPLEVELRSLRARLN